VTSLSAARPRQVLLILVAVVAVAALLFGLGWWTASTMARPAHSPHEAIGRFEDALRDNDAEALSRLLTIGAVEDRRDRAQRLIERYGDPEFRFIEVNLGATESGSFYVVRAVALLRTERTAVTFGVQDVMNLDTGGSDGWHVSM